MSRMGEGARSAGGAVRPAAVLVACGVALAVPGEAWAYIDPGTGSYVLQTIVAGLLGAAFAVKTFWGNIRAWISRTFGKGGHRPDGP